MTTTRRTARGAVSRKAVARRKRIKPSTRPLPENHVQPVNAAPLASDGGAFEPTDAINTNGVVAALKSGEAFAHIARACTNHAWAVIIVFFVLAGLGAGLAATSLKVDTDPGQAEIDVPVKEEEVLEVDQPQPGDGGAADNNP